MLPDITVRLFAWKRFGNPDREQEAAERAQDDPTHEERRQSHDALHWFCASHVKPTCPVRPWAANTFCTCTVNR